MRQYKYTLLKQDGTIKEFGRQDEWDFKKIRKVLKCDTIELIPQDYKQHSWGRCLIYGDEEGRFNSDNKRNPFTKVLKGHPEYGEPSEWDCVGDLLLAQW